MSENVTLSNPFPGLRPFEADEEHLFFGRDGQSDELLRRLRRSRFLAVLGTSGSGKSSLVRAGLLPALYGGIMTQAGSSWRVALFRPGYDPVGNLAHALSDPEVFGDGDDDSDLQQTITEATLRRSALGLVEATRQARMSPHENLLVVVDQFEEIFRFRRSRKAGSEDAAAAFVKLLLEAKAQTDIPIYIVITMRSDFLGDCSQFRDLPEAINEGQFLIPRMTRDQRREAIAGPIAVSGGAMSPRLMNRLLNDVGDNPDQLPILQHSLMRTWEYWSEHRRAAEPLDLQDYEAVGTMSEALSRHADEAYNELPDEKSRNVAEKLFKSLTEKGFDNREIRRPTRVKEICAVAEASQPEVIAVIERFRQPGRSFLMPPTKVELEADSLIDISHESLIRGWERLRTWVEEEARSAQIYRRLSETAALHKEGSAGLWHNPDLAVALNWREKNRPNAIWAQHYNPSFEEAMGFLSASKSAKEAEIAERERQRKMKIRRTRLFVGVLSIAFILSFWMAMLANTARIKAETQTQIAQAATRDAIEQRRIAVDQKAIAVGKAQEAETERQRAAEQAEIAEAAKDTAEEQAEIARAAQAASELARQEAIASETAAIKARKDLQAEFLETRKASLSSNSTIVTLSNRLIELSAPREAAVWRSYYANALSMLGNHQRSVDEASAALEIEPDFVGVRAHRGYMYMLTHQPLKSVDDFNKVIEATPYSSLPYLNRAIVNGQLGRLVEARSDIDMAINLFRSGEYDSLSESELAEDIQAVIGRNFLTVDESDYFIALLYERANLQAAAGDLEFTNSLQHAHRQRLNASSSKGAPLTALNWAWLHRRERSVDYGILASEASLWEQAGRPDLARRYYNLFFDEHRKRSDARYNQVAGWATRQLNRLPATNGDNSNDVTYAALVVEADQLSLNENYQAALQRLNQAIELAPSQKLPSFLLKRADIKFNLKDYPGSEQDASTALESAKTPQAFHYRARAMAWRDWDGTKEKARADLTEALKLDATYAPAISQLAAISDDAEGLSLYKRLSKIWPNGAWIYREIAVLENRLGKKEEATHSIETAIDIYIEGLESFDVRADIETSLGRPVEEVQRHQIQGYRQAIASLLRHNKPGASLAYLKLAQLQDKFKLAEEALLSVNKAIELDPTNTDFYDLRATVETGLGRSADSVLLRKANSYLQAVEVLLDRGKNLEAVAVDLKLNTLIGKGPASAFTSFAGRSDATKRRLATAYIESGDSLLAAPSLALSYRAYKQSAQLLTSLGAKSNDATLVGDLDLVLSKLKHVRELARNTTTAELMSARIITINGTNGATREVTIDRGSADGVTKDGEASAWSINSVNGEHEREVKKLGNAKILTLGERSATVSVTMDNPSGDGLVIVGDMIEVRALVPGIPDRSLHWGAAKYHIDFTTEDGKPILGSYRSLYFNETEELVQEVLDALVADIKKTAVVLATHEAMSRNLTEGRYKGKTLKQAMESPTRDDVFAFLTYVMKFPARHYGKDVKVGRAFGNWALQGTPQ